MGIFQNLADQYYRERLSSILIAFIVLWIAFGDSKCTKEGTRMRQAYIMRKTRGLKKTWLKKMLGLKLMIRRRLSCCCNSLDNPIFLKVDSAEQAIAVFESYLWTILFVCMNINIDLFPPHQHSVTLYIIVFNRKVESAIILILNIITIQYARMLI